MKLLLLSSILLLVPLAFANDDPAYAKIIYSDQLVFGEFTNFNDTPTFTFRRDPSTMGFFLFGDEWGYLMQTTVSRDAVNSMKGASKSFVVESLALERDRSYWKRRSEKPCQVNTSPELKSLIKLCSGELSLRPLNPEETSQVEKVKASMKETGKDVQVFYEKNRILFQAVQIKRFDIELRNETAVRITAYRELPTAISLAQYLGISSPSAESYWELSARRPLRDPLGPGCCYPGRALQPPIGKSRRGSYFDSLPRYRDPRPRVEEILMRVLLHNYQDKRFGIEVPANGLTNCYRPPVSGLKATDCLGSVKITNGLDGNPAPSNPEPRNPEPGNPEPSNPEPSNPEPRNPEPDNPGNRVDDSLLDDMSTEELKKLLKDILGRM